MAAACERDVPREILPPVDRPAVRRWCFSQAREAFQMSQAARRRGDRPLARTWLQVSRSLRITAYSFGGGVP